jgi:hypothetical protein
MKFPLFILQSIPATSREERARLRRSAATASATNK